MSKEEEKRKLEELGEALDQVEEEAAERRSLAFKSFKELYLERSQIYEVDVPELGCRIRYGKLTVLDWMEIRDVKDPDELRRRSLYLMWRRGDPTVEEKEIDQMPFDEVSAVLNRMMEATPFLHLRWLTQPSAASQSSGASTPS